VARPLRDEDLAPLAAARPLVVLLDVDGTLAPIAARPEDARVPDDTRAAVRRLAESPGVHVALVSGRPAADARRLVGVDGVWAIGSHGAERVAPDGGAEIDPSVAAHEDAVARAAAALTGALGTVPGVLVECKRWSTAVHYRLADRARVPDIVAAARAAAEREGLRAGDGKEVVELRAPVDVDKGTAVLALLDRLGGRAAGAASLFVGDDVTDEDGFRRLADVAGALTVRVGRADATTAASVVVDDPATVRDLLERLAASRRPSVR
jgi:trehalose 6-phosphate phosphatase